MKMYLTEKLAGHVSKVCASSLLLMALTTTVSAQDSGSRLEELIVTATKRSQTLQDTPIAISVVSADEIEQAEIKDVFDLQSIVPSLRVSQGASTANAGFSIRGFGGAASNAGIEPSVGVFVDGIYRSRAAAQISDLLNISRVEVLRGPQSTLFGKNASVGVVSLISKEPEFETDREVTATIGSDSTIRVGGNFTGPISDSVAYRFAASYNESDGYADDLATGADLNNSDRFGVQGQILYTPNDDLSVKVIVDYDEIDERCCLASNIVSGPITDFVVGALGQFVDEDPFSYTGFSNFVPRNEIENAGISLHIDKNVGFADFISITSFRTLDTFGFGDADATSADIVSGQNGGEVDTFTQEFRLTSNSDSAVSWLVGLSHFDETIEQPGEFLYGRDFRAFADALSGGAFTGLEAAFGLPIGRAFGVQGQGPIEERGQDNQSTSLFANVDWAITDQLTATVGLSYIKDEKEAFFRQQNTDAFSALDFTAIGFAQILGGLGVNASDPRALGAFAAANPATFRAIQAASANPATNPLLALRPFQFNPPFLDFPNSVEDGKSDDDDVTYNLRLAYDVNDNLNVYASYATGFKATSWNLSRNSRPFPSDFIPGSPVTSPAPSPIRNAGLAVPNLTTGTRFAGPEETEVFELGLKLNLDNLNLNLAIFDQTVEGFQSNSFTGVGFALSNAGEQSTKGFEIDGKWAVTDALTLSFSGAFYDPKFDSFPGSPNGDLTGRRPAGIPKVVTSLGADYIFLIGGNDAFIRADWQHTGSSDYSNNEAFQQLIGFQNESDLVNASAGIILSNGTTITLWGRNIFDEEFIVGAFPSIAQSGSASGFPNAPASYGVTVRHKF